MTIPGLTLIGESINDSVPSTRKLYDNNDIEGVKALAKAQDEGGAAWIDVNVGLREPAFMARMVREIQSVTTKPLSIDSPDYTIAAAGLDAYDPERANGKPPILNSIAATRTQLFDLFAHKPFMPILLTSEREENGTSKPNRTGEENYQTARALIQTAESHGIPANWCIIDPGIAPIGSDTEGLIKMVLDAMKHLHEDPACEGIHMSVGLSNFTVMLPPKTSAGDPVKGPLESAFLTLAMPLGLDFIISNVKRNHQTLTPDHPAMLCLQDVLQREGYDCIMRVMEFYM